MVACYLPLLLTAVIATAIAGPIPSESFAHTITLDEYNQYTLSWSFNATSITFEARVQTTGWVGFGISPNGGMLGADIVIGWVDSEGQAFFKDRYGTGKEMPKIDPRQDWFLLYANKQDGVTVLQFTRLLDTKDCEHDQQITPDTQRVIWAYNNEIPENEDKVIYHGATNRGAKSVGFIETSTGKHSSLPSSAVSYSFVQSAVRLPSDDTFYWCKSFNMPKLTTRHHIIKIEPVIQRENRGVVHHIDLYSCYVPINESMHGLEWTCYTNAMPPDFLNCRHPMAVWSIGGDAFYYPEEVGLSIGGPGDPTFVILQIHYDNPQGRADIVDSSGLKIWYTPELRRYDAGILATGYLSSGYTLIIPPGQPLFHIRGVCVSECTQSGLPESGVKAFAYLLHTHLTGRRMRLSQYRGSTLIGELGRDDHFDFNYQSTRLYTEEKTIMPGDTLVLDCFFDSTKRDKPTFGGLATSDEMCYAWYYYYPRAEISSCQSVIPVQPIYQHLGLGNVTDNFAKPDEPNFWLEYYQNLTWTPEFTNSFQKLQTETDSGMYCRKATSEGHEVFNQVLPYPKFIQSLKERERECLSDVQTTATTAASGHYTTSIALLISAIVFQLI